MVSKWCFMYFNFINCNCFKKKIKTKKEKRNSLLWPHTKANKTPALFIKLKLVKRKLFEMTNLLCLFHYISFLLLHGIFGNSHRKRKKEPVRLCCTFNSLNVYPIGEIGSCAYCFACVQIEMYPRMTPVTYDSHFVWIVLFPHNTFVLSTNCFFLVNTWISNRNETKSATKLCRLKVWNEDVY